MNADVSHNKITEVDSLETMLAQCPAVQQLNVLENPICQVVHLATAVQSFVLAG